MTRPLLAAAGAAAVGACVPTGHLARENAPLPVFDPLAFFAGATEGRGMLKVALHHGQPTLVEGHGLLGADGTITLDQTVRRGDAPVTARRWQLRRMGSERVSGTLSDARGPVTGEIAGNRLHLSFAMKGGTSAQQWLYLQPGGRVARNVMVIRKFGLPVARLDEVITRR